MNPGQVWDDVIVGAGSSGAVLASRLSEQSERQVLLVEAGPDFPQPSQMPDALKDSRSPVMSGYNWEYFANLHSSGLLQNLLQSAGVLAASPRDMFSAAKVALCSPQPLATTLQQFPYFIGKVVGGSSAINGAIALRGLQEDFDQWAALGNTEWGWAHVLPYFKKVETDHDFPGTPHGINGLLPVTRPDLKKLHALQAAFLEACRSLGLAYLADLNGSSATGVGPVPTNTVNHIRSSTATAYLALARARPNLTIQAGCMVNRVLFERQQAVGVELIMNGKQQSVFAKRITFSAGAINTVALLLRSGVGSSTLCRSLGISPVIDLPGVGENLIDHPGIMLWMKPKVGAGDEKKQQHHEIMARFATESNKSPDLNFFILSNFATATVPMLEALLGSPLANGLSVMLATPASRGRVFLENSDPASKPLIELNLGSAPEDLARLMYGVRLAWKIARSRPIAERTQSIFLWTENIINNDSFLRSAIKRFIVATWHAVGTAKMGPVTDPMAVVDQHCRVHGVQNLYVVDASVMPLIPSAPTNLTCIMLAERAADWMKQEIN